jgi:formyl-CoA transferase
VRDPVARAENIDKIYLAMNEIAPSRTTAEWQELLLRLDVPHTAFAKISEITEQEHLKAVDYFATIDHPSEGRIRQARPSTKFSEDPPNVHRPTPRLGEHSREVLTEAGYSAAEIDALVAAGAVGEG